VLECDERLWDKLMDINLKGAYFISQAVANHYGKARRWKNHQYSFR